MEINFRNNKRLLWSRSLLLQVSETSSGKLLFSLLVILATMEDRRRRLEDAEDSPLPVNETGKL